MSISANKALRAFLLLPQDAASPDGIIRDGDWTLVYDSLRVRLFWDNYCVASYRDTITPVLVFDITTILPTLSSADELRISAVVRSVKRRFSTVDGFSDDGLSIIRGNDSGN